MHTNHILVRPNRAYALLLCFCAMLALAAAPAPLAVQPGPISAHPILVSLAETKPDTLVSVIVQGHGDAQIERQVAQLGGAVTRDLGMVNALVADMTAGAAVELARHPQVRWVSPDAPVQTNAGPDGPVDTSRLINVYNRAIRAEQLWAEGYQGSSVTVAVLDSGIADLNDFKELPGGGGDLRILTTASIVESSDKHKDWYGHGTHVAGIIAGNGTLSDGKYIGVAPKARLIAVDVADEIGAGTTADVIAGLQWIYDNKDAYNIRVVNISLNSSIAEPYHASALNAAVEILWFNGIVVVVSAGNNGGGSNSGILYPPANDPFVITVGAADDRGTATLLDDVMASYTARGLTESGFLKPEIVAPGSNIISALSKQDNTVAVEHPSHLLADPNHRDTYFRMSGTSMAAPMVSGAVALLLQDEPELTPDQVKFRLMATSRKAWRGFPTSGAGYLDAYAAVKGMTQRSANTGIVASPMLWTGSDPLTWGSARWGSARWGSARWGSVNWSTARWGSVNWGSDHWDN